MCMPSTPKIPDPPKPIVAPPPPAPTAQKVGDYESATKDREGTKVARRRRGTAGLRTAGLQIMS